MRVHHWKILWTSWLNVYIAYISLICCLTYSGWVALLWHKVLQTPELHSSQQHLSSRVLKCSLALIFPSQSSVCLSCSIHAACRPATCMSLRPHISFSTATSALWGLKVWELWLRITVCRIWFCFVTSSGYSSLWKMVESVLKMGATSCSEMFLAVYRVVQCQFT
jgi:hypothetical protein